jgi:two-component system chemotaxis sensor kinase CheA
MDSDVNIDLSQFHEIFFEECAEGIAVMEAELLNLNVGKPDFDVVNTIFRAAHSIKGSAGTFGFPKISEFTHAMETALDKMRDGTLEVTTEGVESLLASVDCLRSMIDCSKNDKPFDEDTSLGVQKKLEALTENVSEAVVEEKADDAEEGVSKDTASIAWYISFYPNENLFYTGNDPFRLIRELQSLGRLDVVVDASKLPDFSEIGAENCYLGWEMVLHGNVTLNEINEVFAWVEGDCELEIHLEEDRRSNPDRRDDDGKVTGGRRKTDSSGLHKQETTSIRVSTDKVDGLLNLVGELVITQSILSRVISDMEITNTEKLNETLDVLERNTRDLQEQTMGIRMLPIDFAFQRLPRLVHDLSHSLGKNVELDISGESTELDKNVLEKIGDPLMHLVRNALDHGIEKPEVRSAAGKNETGFIGVSAHHLGGSIIIEIEDDGAGIDSQRVLDKAIENGLINENEELSQTQIHNLIFLPGFSTAVEVSDISGRGVGMDVVKRNITDLGGTVELTAVAGKGSKFTIRLPLTLAILDGQMIRVGDQVYIIPIHSIIETLQVYEEKVSELSGQTKLYHYRDEYISIIPLHEVFDVRKEEKNGIRELLVVIDIGGRRVGLSVDEVVGQQQVVIKSLETNYKQINGLAGATVLGDGSVALILDVLGLSHYYVDLEAVRSVNESRSQLH